MAELKTQPNDKSVEAYLNAISDEARRKDCFTLLEMMQQATGAPPVMWGDAIVGFGNYHYSYASGREGDWFQVGFSPRKQNLTLYLISGFDQYQSLLARLGKHSTSKSCLYIKRLSDVDLSALQELVRRSVEQTAGGKS
jgi:hypothetical protein